jgi:hypothetical protein
MAEDWIGRFAIPGAVRSTAEQGFESTREALDRIFLAAKESLAAIGDQADVAQTAGRKIEEIALQFAEQNVMRAFRLARQLVQSRDIGEVVRLHTEFMESQILSFAGQARVFADGTTEPEEPCSGRRLDAAKGQGRQVGPHTDAAPYDFSHRKIV